VPRGRCYIYADLADRGDARCIEHKSLHRLQDSDRTTMLHDHLSGSYQHDSPFGF